MEPESGENPATVTTPIVPKRGVGRPRADGLPPGSGPSRALRHKARAVSSKRQENMAKHRQVVVNLAMQHRRNGISYGPGAIKLPYTLAQELLGEESHAAHVEEQFQGTKAVVIGARDPRTGSHRTTQVPGETFDDSFMNMPPSSVVPKLGG